MKNITTPLLVLLVTYVFVYFMLSSRENIKRDGLPTNEYAIVVGMTAIHFVFSPIGNAEATLRNSAVKTWTYRQYMPRNGVE